MPNDAFAHSERAPDWALLALAALALGATALGRCFTALRPGSHDAQLFAYIGGEWSRGRTPYLAVWDNKPPGIFAVDALTFRVFGRSFAALALVEAVFILGTVVAVYLLVRLWEKDWRAAALAGTVVAFGANLNFLNQGGNLTEIYLLWPATLSMCFFSIAQTRQHSAWFFLAGCCSGFASLFKPTGLAPLLAQGGYLLGLAWYRRLAVRSCLRHLFTISLGWLVAWLPFLLYFGRRHALAAVIDASFIYNVKYGAASQRSAPRALFGVIDGLQEISPLFVCFLLCLFATARGLRKGRLDSSPPEGGKGESSLLPLAIMWVFFDVAGAMAGGRGYHHYFLAAVPSLSVCAGLAYGTTFSGRRQPVLMQVAFSSLVLLPIALRQVVEAGELFRPAETLRVEPWKVIASRLRSLEKPGDTLFTWDYWPGIYFETGIRNANPWLDAHYRNDMPKEKVRSGRRLLEELREHPPTFVVMGEAAPLGEKTGQGSDPEEARFADWLGESFDVVDKAGGLRLYRRRGDAVGSAPVAD